MFSVVYFHDIFLLLYLKLTRDRRKERTRMLVFVNAIIAFALRIIDVVATILYVIVARYPTQRQEDVSRTQGHGRLHTPEAPLSPMIANSSFRHIVIKIVRHGSRMSYPLGIFHLIKSDLVVWEICSIRCSKVSESFTDAVLSLRG